MSHFLTRYRPELLLCLILLFIEGILVALFVREFAAGLVFRWAWFTWLTWIGLALTPVAGTAYIVHYTWRWHHVSD